MHVFNYNTIDLKNDLVYDKAKKSMYHDGFSVKVQVKGPNGALYPFIHQGPRMTIPFGLCKKEAEGRRDNYPCTFSLDGLYKSYEGTGWVSNIEGDPTLSYHDFIAGLDEQNIKIASQNCQEWFKANKSRDVLDELYHAMLTYADEDKYAPKFSTKLMCWEDKFTTKFFNEQRDPITFDDICSDDGQIKRLSAIPLIETTGLWFAGKRFGMSMRIRQLLVYPDDNNEVQSYSDTCMIDINEDETPIPISKRKLETEQYTTPIAFNLPTPKRSKLEEMEEEPMDDCPN